MTSNIKSKVIILPEEINADTYETFVPVILSNLNKPIHIMCRGDGGSCRYAVALIDAIQYHNDVTAFLTSEANSSHSMIFAACKHRYTFPNGRLGVHESGWHGAENIDLDSAYAQFLAYDFDYYNNYAARLYAGISNKPLTYWKRNLNRVGIRKMKYFTSEELISMGMALPIGAYPRKKLAELWAN